MEVLGNNYGSDDQPLVDKIVCELKSQGIFDQFRKECFSDVDTKPAYQNLRQRVEGSVSSFLSTQQWRPDMNKNQVREMLRKTIVELGFLETGVERVVDQVVNPKINSVFLPKVEEVVFNYLGIQKPADTTQLRMQTIETVPMDLLPTDLEAVSPESTPIDKSMDKSFESIPNLDESSKMEEEQDESPPFEPLEEQPSSNVVAEDNSVDSHMSGFSGLVSHESNDSKPLQIDLSQQDSQMSRNSCDSRLSIITNDNEIVKPDVSADVEKDSSAKIEEAGVNSNFDTTVNEVDNPINQVDNKVNEVDNNKSSSSSKDRKESKESSKHRESSSKSSSKTSRDSKRSRSEKSKERDQKKSIDRVKESSNSSNGSSNGHKKDSKSESSKKVSSSSHKEKSDHDRSNKSRSDKDRSKSSRSHSDNKSKDKDKDRSDNRSKDKNASENKSKDKGHSSSKSRDKGGSDSRSKDRHKSSSGDSKHRSEKSSKDDKRHHDSKREKDRKREHSKKESKDDHYSSKHKSSSRRSTDRDSNDGHSSKQSSFSNIFSNGTASQAPTNGQKQITTSNSNGGSVCSDQVETRQASIVEVQNTIHRPLVISKPKYAKNMQEALKLMKIRKQLAKLEKQNQLSLTEVEVCTTTLISSSISLDDIKPNGMNTNGEKNTKLSQKDVNSQIASTLETVPLPLQNTIISQDNWDMMEAKLLKEVCNEFSKYSKEFDSDKSENDICAMEIDPPLETTKLETSITSDVSIMETDVDTSNVIQSDNDVTVTLNETEPLDATMHCDNSHDNTHTEINDVSDEIQNEDNSDEIHLLTLSELDYAETVDVASTEEEEDDEVPLFESTCITEDSDVAPIIGTAQNTVNDEMCRYFEKVDLNTNEFYQYAKKVIRKADEEKCKRKNGLRQSSINILRTPKRKMTSSPRNNGGKAAATPAKKAKKGFVETPTKQKLVLHISNNNSLQSLKDEKSNNVSFPMPLASIKAKPTSAQKTANKKRYSSEDLYKPRLTFTSSRRRGANLGN